jgi:hypothetical protein
MNAAASPRRWYRLTPDRLVIVLLVLECLLWLSDRLALPAWHKGYAVLTAVAMVSVALSTMLLWCLIALIFRKRFQFSIRSFLLLAIAVAVPCSWLAVEMKKASNQKAYVATIRGNGGEAWYLDVQLQVPSISPAAAATERKWLRDLLGEDFFYDVTSVNMDATVTDLSVTNADLKPLAQLPQLRSLFFHRLYKPKLTDDGLDHLRSLSHLRFLDLRGSSVTDAGVEKLQKVLPDCQIQR